MTAAQAIEYALTSSPLLLLLPGILATIAAARLAKSARYSTRDRWTLALLALPVLLLVAVALSVRF